MTSEKVIISSIKKTSHQSSSGEAAAKIKGSKTGLMNPQRTSQKDPSSQNNQEDSFEMHLIKMRNTLAEQQMLLKKNGVLATESESEALKFDDMRSNPQSTNLGINDSKNQKSIKTESSKLSENKKEFATEIPFPDRFIGASSYGNIPMTLLQNPKIPIAAHILSGQPQILTNPSYYAMLNNLLFNSLYQKFQYPHRTPSLTNPEFFTIQEQFELQNRLFSQVPQSYLEQKVTNPVGIHKEVDVQLPVKNFAFEASTKNPSTAVSKDNTKAHESQEKPKLEIIPKTTPLKPKKTISKVKAKQAEEILGGMSLLKVENAKRANRLSNSTNKVAGLRGKLKNQQIGQKDLQEPSQLEQNLPLKTARVTRKSKKNTQPSSTLMLGSHFNEMIFKPRKRDRVQIIHEEREKRTNQVKRGSEQQIDQVQDKDSSFNNLKTLVTTNSNGELFLLSEEPRKNVRMGQNYQAVIPQLNLKKHQVPLRKFKNIWNPDDIKEAEIEKLIVLTTSILKTNWCRQDFLARFLRQNNMDSQLTLDLLGSNVDYFSNLMKSKRSYNSFKKIAVPDIENPLTWSDDST